MTHTVKDVRFEPGEPGEAAPIHCACGWSGIVAEWRGHRPKESRRRYKQAEMTVVKR